MKKKNQNFKVQILALALCGMIAAPLSTAIGEEKAEPVKEVKSESNNVDLTIKISNNDDSIAANEDFTVKYYDMKSRKYVDLQEGKTDEKGLIKVEGYSKAQNFVIIEMDDVMLPYIDLKKEKDLTNITRKIPATVKELTTDSEKVDIVISVQTFEGEPIANESVEITWRHRKTRRSGEFFKGKTDDKGQVSVKGHPKVLSTLMAKTNTDSLQYIDLKKEKDLTNIVRKLPPTMEQLTAGSKLVDISLAVQKQDGTPLANKEIKVTWSNRKHRKNGTAFEGTTDENGKIKIEKHPEVLSALSITADGNRLPAVNIASQKDLSNVVLKLPPTTGDMAPDFVMHDYKTGKDVNLSDYKGQVVYLDFWATWCGPCQKPMEKNNELLSKRGKDWEGKAVIIAASIDDALEKVVKHIDDKEWHNITQMWCKEGTPGFGATAPALYGVTGIPTALMIDQSGKIVWRGHPAQHDAEEHIDKLLGNEK